MPTVAYLEDGLREHRPGQVLPGVAASWKNVCSFSSSGGSGSGSSSSSSGSHILTTDCAGQGQVLPSVLRRLMELRNRRQQHGIYLEDGLRGRGPGQVLPGVLRHVRQHRCQRRQQPPQQRRQHRLAGPATCAGSLQCSLSLGSEPTRASAGSSPRSSAASAVWQDLRHKRWPFSESRSTV